jgi:hypothetical protein
VNLTAKQAETLGREVARMIHDLRSVSGEETGFARRTFNIGGEVHVFIANDKHLADAFEAAAASRYDVKDVTPPSQRN